jgi:hypothetical protein
MANMLHVYVFGGSKVPTERPADRTHAVASAAAEAIVLAVGRVAKGDDRFHLGMTYRLISTSASRIPSTWFRWANRGIGAGGRGGIDAEAT